MWLWVGFLAGAAASAPALLAPAGFGRLLQPLTVFHPEWVGERIDTADLGAVAVSRSAGRAGRLLRRRRLRPGVDGRVLLLRHLRLAPARDVLGSRGDRAALVHRPDAAGLAERLRCPRSDLRVLFHEHRPADRVGHPHVAGRRPRWSCCSRSRARPSGSRAAITDIDIFITAGTRLSRRAASRRRRTADASRARIPSAGRRHPRGLPRCSDTCAARRSVPRRPAAA